MLLDRKHRSWGIGTGVVFAAATVVYVLYPQFSSRAYTGGSRIGLVFGVAATLAMVFAGLLAVRKAVPWMPIGSAQFWLRGHIWIGLLSLPLAVYHASFRLGGPFEMALMGVFAIVLASGVFGLAMQQVLPRLLKNRIPLETFPEQIPFLCRRFRAEGDYLVSQRCGKLDVDFAPIREEAYQFALAEGKLRNGKEQEDFAKLLESVYGKPGTNGAPPERAEASRSRGAARTAARSGDGSGSEKPAAKDAAAGAAGESKAAAASAASEKKLSVQEKLAQAKAASGGNPRAPSVASKKPAPSAAPTDGTEKKLSIQDKLAQAKAAGAAKAAAAAGEGKPSIQDKLAQAKAAGAAKKAAALAAATSAKPDPPEAAPAADKKLSIEEKLARAKAASAAKPKETKEKALATKETAAAASALAEGKPAKKPAATAKPGAQALLDRLAGKKQGQERPTATPAAKKKTDKGPLPRADEFKSFYLTEARPFLTEDPRAARRHRFADETVAQMWFANQAGELPEELLKIHHRIESLCEERRQFLEQGRIRAWLHYWLLIHVPLSGVLFVLLAVHIVMALRVVPWEF